MCQHRGAPKINCITIVFLTFFAAFHNLPFQFWNSKETSDNSSLVKAHFFGGGGGGGGVGEGEGRRGG